MTDTFPAAAVLGSQRPQEGGRDLQFSGHSLGCRLDEILETVYGGK